jgi:hypothetical protein
MYTRTANTRLHGVDIGALDQSCTTTKTPNTPEEQTFNITDLTGYKRTGAWCFGIVPQYQLRNYADHTEIKKKRWKDVCIL